MAIDPGAREPENQGDAEDRRHDGDPEQRRDPVVEQFVSGQAQQRTDNGAERVHRAVKPEDPATGGLIDVRDEQRITRRAPQPFPSRSTTRPAITPGQVDAAATMTLPSAAMP